MLKTVTNEKAAKLKRTTEKVTMRSNVAGRLFGSPSPRFTPATTRGAGAGTGAGAGAGAGAWAGRGGLKIYLLCSGV